MIIINLKKCCNLCESIDIKTIYEKNLCLIYCSKQYGSKQDVCYKYLDDKSMIMKDWILADDVEGVE